MGRTEAQPEGLEAWRRRRLRSRLRWALPLLVLLLVGAVALTVAARQGWRLVQPGDRGGTAAWAIAASLLGYAASWFLALDFRRRNDDDPITAQVRFLHWARAAAGFLIIVFLSRVGVPFVRAILSSFLAGVCVAAGLVVVLWTFDHAPFRSPPPDRLSDGTWI